MITKLKKPEGTGPPRCARGEQVASFKRENVSSDLKHREKGSRCKHFYPMRWIFRVIFIKPWVFTNQLGPKGPFNSEIYLNQFIRRGTNRFSQNCFCCYCVNSAILHCPYSCESAFMFPSLPEIGRNCNTILLRKTKFQSIKNWYKTELEPEPRSADSQANALWTQYCLCLKRDPCLNLSTVLKRRFSSEDSTLHHFSLTRQLYWGRLGGACTMKR